MLPMVVVDMQSVRRSTLLAAWAVALGMMGCGTEEVETLEMSGPVATLYGDLVPLSDTGVTTARGALGNGGNGREPSVIYLRYADGSETPDSSYSVCTGTAPPFECGFAPTLIDCQREVQAYLDSWYAKFNVIFTLTRPMVRKYYTVVISSGGGAWCKASDRSAGTAPFLCRDLAGGVAYAFQGGRSAHETAVIVAQEQAHLVGLEHTTNRHDIMYPTVS